MDGESSSNNLNSILLQELFQTFHGLNESFLRSPTFYNCLPRIRKTFPKSWKHVFHAVGQIKFYKTKYQSHATQPNKYSSN